MTMESHHTADELKHWQHIWDDHLDSLPIGAKHPNEPHHTCPNPTDCPCQCPACFPEAHAHTNHTLQS